MINAKKSMDKYSLRKVDCEIIVLACIAGVERGYGGREKGEGLGREGKGRLL